MRLMLLICLLLSVRAHALQIDARFEIREQFNGVTNFEDRSNGLRVSASPTQLRYEDLTAQGVKDVQEVFEVKKEYGKLFGFADWTAQRQQLLETSRGRFFLLQGQYRSNQGHTVYFLEIFHSDRTSGGEYLVTSNSRPVTLEEYQKVFAP